jgi:hypothetical protein
MGDSMTTKGVLAIVGLIAVGVAAYFALVPVTTTVSMSILPDVPLADLQVRIGSKLGLTVSPDGSTEAIDCGSPLLPTEITVAPANGVAGLVDGILNGAERVEQRIKAACGAALRPHRQNAVVAGIAAGVSFVAAVLAGAAQRSSRQRTQPTPTYQQATPTTGAATWPPPPPPSDESVRASQPPISSATGGRRWLLLLGALAGVVVVAAVVAWSASRDSAPASGNGAPEPESQSTEEDPQRAVERRCIEETMSSADRIFDGAATASAADLEASVNRDGDSSWRQYAVNMQSLAVSACPVDFQSAFVDYTNAWREFGDAWIDATDGLVKDRMSEEEHQLFETRINQARTLIESIARQYKAAVSSASFSLPSFA